MKNESIARELTAMARDLTAANWAYPNRERSELAKEMREMGDTIESNIDFNDENYESDHAYRKRVDDRLERLGESVKDAVRDIASVLIKIRREEKSE